MLKILALILVFYSSIELISTGMRKLWSFELVEIDIVKTDPELVDAFFEVVRVGRGKLGISGNLDIKIDMYDNVTVGAIIERSKSRAGPYTLTPFALQNMKFSTYINTIYKTMIYPRLENCSENAAIVNDTFVQPLTKRCIKLYKCEFNTENMPNIMMEGYYRTKAYFRGAVRLAISVLMLVESEIF